MGQSVVMALLFAGWGVTLFLLVRSGGRLRSQDRVHKAELDELQSRMERLMTEVHRTTAALVEQMESRGEAVRHLVSVCDERIRKLRELLTDLEIMGSRLRAPAPAPESPAPAGVRPTDLPSPVGLPVTAVHDLSKRGLSAKDIAEHMGMSVPEVTFLLKMKKIS